MAPSGENRAGGILLMDENEGRERVKQYFTSKQWWVIPVVGQNASAFLCRLEERFFSGKRAAGFDLVMGPHPPWKLVGAIGFARKGMLPAARLAAFAREIGAEGIATNELREQDILMLGDPGMTDAEMDAWTCWLNLKYGFREDLSDIGAGMHRLPDGDTMHGAAIDRGTLQDIAEMYHLPSPESALNYLQFTVRGGVMLCSDREMERLRQEIPATYIGQREPAEGYHTRPCLVCECTVYHDVPLPRDGLSICQQCFAAKRSPR